MTKSEAQKFVLNELMLVRAIPIATDRLAVLCHYQPAAAEGIYLSQVLSVDHSGNWRDLGRFKWHGVDIAVRPDGELLVLGRDGQIGSISGTSTSEAWLEKGRALGPMRGISALGDRALAYGMNRNVYVFRGADPWRRFESGFSADSGDEVDFDKLLEGMGGINAVARTASDEFVAVGMNGEVWRTPAAADRWTPQDSGTNISLSAIFIDDSGAELACGQAGTVLSNRSTGWKPVPYHGTEHLDFTSAVGTHDSVLLADGHSLRRLKDGDLAVVGMGTPEMVPCAKLAAGFGQVAGCAPKELFYSHDGVSWSLLL